MQEARGKASLVNSWIKRRAILHSHPQSSKPLNCQPSCSHKNSTKNCERRKSELPPMWKCRTDTKFTRYQQDAQKIHGEEGRQRLLAGNTEMSLSHGIDSSDRNAAESKHPDFWEQMHSQEHTRKLEVPYTGQIRSRISEVWWADVIQARKCWPSNKQRQWKYTASPGDFGTNQERTFSSQTTQTTSSLQTSVQTEGR